MANIMRLGGGGGNSEEVKIQADLIGEIKEKLGLLPSEYTPLDHIESTGTQYINWGISVPHASEKIVVEFSPTSTDADNVICGHAATTWSWATNLAFVLNERIWVANTGVGVAEINVGTFYTFEYTTATCSVNGTSQALNSGSYTDGYNNTLFYASTKYGKHKVKSYKLYNGTTLVRNAVPCLNANGKAGMYDLVNGVFYGNAGTGEFKYDSPLSQIKQNTADLEDILDTVKALPSAAPVLLWTNASPTSAFAAQTVSVNGTGYSGYLVEVSSYGSNVTWPEMGKHPAIAYIWPDDSSTVDAYNQVIAVQGRLTDHNGRKSRVVLAATTSSITFDSGRNGTTSDTTAAIPTRIWGVKFSFE